ncbi:hypothetical protein DPMN_190861 [Dreissena polymorpha]|uniref:Uncharacterized protein n=1 Tax=Dreissena polymorpha TaxID=45954 RepID=A0A9D3Y068_DREPO|nr:hypothetical protein DPMN_190861 [Dreissena polymorpha]
MYVGTMLAQEGIADIHTNVGPTSSRVALPISGRCNYRCRADIHTDVGPTLRRVALPVSGRCNNRSAALLRQAAELLNYTIPAPASKEAWTSKYRNCGSASTELLYPGVIRGHPNVVEIDRIVIRDIQYQLEVNRCRNEEVNVFV